jgi:competence protein ComEC
VRPAGSIQLSIAIGAGLVTGLAHFPDPLSVAIAVVVGAWLTRRPAHLTLALATVLAIVGGARLSAAHNRSCAAVLEPGERRIQVLALDPGINTGRGLPRDLDCEGAVRTRWPASSAVPAGHLATVSARWLPREGRLGRAEGILIVRKVESSTGSPSLLARSRNAVSQQIAGLFGERAGLVEALVVGRTGGIDAEVRDRFAAAGLVHVLSISGFHMGLIAFWLLLVLRLSGLPPRHAEIVAAVAVTAYAGWLGWPPPATRAAALFVVVMLSRRRQRSVRPDALLGASAVIVMMIDPESVLDLGAWFSFTAMAGVLWASAWYRRIGSSRTIEGVVASVGATLATAPVSALTIGRVAAIGPVVNLVGLPIAAVAVPAIFIAILGSWILPDFFATGFVASANLLLAMLDRTAAIGAALPGAAGAVEPGVGAAIPWLVLLAVALHATHGGTTPGEALRRTGWCAAGLVWLPLMPRLPVGNADGLGLHFLDVGQGDAVAIRTPLGRWVIVDAGPADARYDAGERVVVPFLKRRGAKSVAMMIISHAHRDHVGGAVSVASTFPVGIALDPGEPFEEPTYLAWLDTLTSRGVGWYRAVAGTRWTLDGVEFEVLHPAAGWEGQGLDLNEDSAVLLVRYGEFTALLSGDTGEASEPEWSYGIEPVDLLKVGHHGSRGSTGSELLRRTSPRAAVISLGRNNYGHPAPATLARLADAGVRVWRTDVSGHVSVDTDGRSFTVRDGRGGVTFDARNLNPE